MDGGRNMLGGDEVDGTMGGGRNMLGGDEVDGSGERSVIRGVRSDSGDGERAAWR